MKAMTPKVLHMTAHQIKQGESVASTFLKTASLCSCIKYRNFNLYAQNYFSVLKVQTKKYDFNMEDKAYINKEIKK